MFVLRRRPLSGTIGGKDPSSSRLEQQPIDLAAFESLADFGSSTLDTYSNFHLQSY
jgi:hypothetical protein